MPIGANQSDEEIADLLRNSVEEHSLGKSEAIAVISRGDSELREIELPPSPDDELPDMVRFKAKSDFASFNDRWLIDFVSLDTDQSLPRRVLATAIPPAVEERVQKIVRPSGLKLKRIVLRPFAIMNLLESHLSGDQARLVINPGDQFTDVVVAKGSQTVSARTIRTSVDHSAEQRSQQLLSEVRRTIASSKRQLDGTPISGVVLLDDKASNRHLIGNLEERLDIAVECRQPFDGLQLAGKLKKGVESPWKFTPLLGSLALQASERDPAIDFLNPTRRAEVKSDRSRWIVYSCLAAAAMLGTIGFGWLYLRSQASEIDELNERLVSQIKRNEDPGTGPSVDEILKKAALVDNWLKSDINWLDELDAISRRLLTADDAIVSKFDAKVSQQGPIVDVSGKVASSKIQRALFETLEARPYGVTNTKSSIEEGNEEYPITFGKLLKIQPPDGNWVGTLDKRADSFKKTTIQPPAEMPAESNQKEVN